MCEHCDMPTPKEFIYGIIGTALLVIVMIPVLFFTYTGEVFLIIGEFLSNLTLKMIEILEQNEKKCRERCK